MIRTLVSLNLLAVAEMGAEESALWLLGVEVLLLLVVALLGLVLLVDGDEDFLDDRLLGDGEVEVLDVVLHDHVAVVVVVAAERKKHIAQMKAFGKFMEDIFFPDSLNRSRDLSSVPHKGKWFLKENSLVFLVEEGKEEGEEIAVALVVGRPLSRQRRLLGRLTSENGTCYIFLIFMVL